jgi:hypothetical protein
MIGWGLELRTLGPIRAIGADEIQYAKGHKKMGRLVRDIRGRVSFTYVKIRGRTPQTPTRHSLKSEISPSNDPHPYGLGRMVTREV